MMKMPGDVSQAAAEDNTSTGTLISEAVIMQANEQKEKCQALSEKNPHYR